MDKEEFIEELGFDTNTARYEDDGSLTIPLDEISWGKAQSDFEQETSGLDEVQEKSVNGAQISTLMYENDDFLLELRAEYYISPEHPEEVYELKIKDK